MLRAISNLFSFFIHPICNAKLLNLKIKKKIYLHTIQQLDSIFLCVCTIIDHRKHHDVQRCSSHKIMCSVIYCNMKVEKMKLFCFAANLNLKRSTKEFTPSIIKHCFRLIIMQNELSLFCSVYQTNT